jgi:hypothetical protein
MGWVNGFGRKDHSAVSLVVFKRSLGRLVGVQSVLHTGQV